MDDLRLYDANGNSITSFTQWDYNRIVYLHGDFDDTPAVHFATSLTGDAQIIPPARIDNVTLSVMVPNDYLMKTTPFYIYIYVDNGSEGKTIRSARMTINARSKPQSYYPTGITGITGEQALAIVKQQVDDNSVSADKLWSASKINNEISSLEKKTVKTINGLVPDENGNVAVEVSGQGSSVSGITAEQATNIVNQKIDDASTASDKVWSAQKVSNELANVKTGVKTVNGTAPDSNGNVTINVTGGGSSVSIDTTLKESGKAADAKAVGDELSKLSSEIGNKADKSAIPTVPTALKNPNALTFTGAVTGTYDGSKALTINIPSGGASGGLIVKGTVTGQSGSTYTGTADKSVSEINAALAKGQQVYLYMQAMSAYLPYSSGDSSTANFVAYQTSNDPVGINMVVTAVVKNDKSVIAIMGEYVSTDKVTEMIQTAVGGIENGSY